MRFPTVHVNNLPCPKLQSGLDTKGLGVWGGQSGLWSSHLWSRAGSGLLALQQVLAIN